LILDIQRSFKDENKKPCLGCTYWIGQASITNSTDPPLVGAPLGRNHPGALQPLSEKTY